MINVALYEPEIPPNTGNIIRLCANTGAQLHLVEPLGFAIEDKRMRRAGLDYHEWVNMKIHPNYSRLIESLSEPGAPSIPATAPSEEMHSGLGKIYAITTKGSTNYTDVDYAENDLVVFGPETRGLPEDILDQLPATQQIRIPMQAGNRSLNLSNAVAIIVYEAWRQHSFNNAL